MSSAWKHGWTHTLCPQETLSLLGNTHTILSLASFCSKLFLQSLLSTVC